MRATTLHRRARGVLARLTLAAGVAAVVASCGCAPFDPSAGGPSTTVDPDGTTTTVDPGGTTRQSKGGTTTTVDPGGTTTTTVDPGGTTTTTTTLPGGEPGDTVDVDALESGQCATPADDDLFVDDVELNDCDEAHLAEVIGSIEIEDGTYPDDAYPGNDRIVPDAYEACQPRFEAYVGIPFWDSVYDIRTITPSPSTWAEGDRTITCLVVDVDGAPLTRAVRDSQR